MQGDKYHRDKLGANVCYTQTPHPGTDQPSTLKNTSSVLRSQIDGGGANPGERAMSSAGQVLRNSVICTG